MLILLALIGDEATAGYDTVTGYARVDPKDGANFFTENLSGPHRYVIKNQENAFYRDAIDRRISS